MLPVLRAGLAGVTVGTWMPNVDHRELPYVHLRRAGGTRHETRPDLLAFPEVEVTVYHPDGLPEAEDLYEDLLTVLLVPGLRVSEVDGASQVPSNIPDAVAVQGTVRVAIRS